MSDYATMNATSNVGRINLPTRFDMVSSARFRMSFLKLLCDPNLQQLVLDLNGTAYIDSCGIGTLIAWHKTCVERGKEMAVENCSDKVMDIFKMVGVDRLFVCHGAVAAA